MAGIRITHPKLRNTTYVVPVLDRPFTAPLYCHKCQQDHLCKTYHLKLDDQGSIIVSQGVLDELLKVGMARLNIGNEVKRPPTQGIGMDQPPPPVPPLVKANGNLMSRLGRALRLYK